MKRKALHSTNYKYFLTCFLNKLTLEHALTSADMSFQLSTTLNDNIHIKRTTDHNKKN